MAGVGLGLLAQLITEGKSPGALGDLGVSHDDFSEDERPVLAFLTDHFRKFDEMPNLRTVEVETGVKLAGFPKESLGYWSEGVKRRTSRTLILNSSEVIRTAARSNDIVAAQAAVQELAFRLQAASPAERVSMMATVARLVIDSHDRRRSSGSLSGVPFGLEYLDYITDGAQPGDSVAFVGRPGVGKTYVLLKSALSAWEAGAVPLLHSMEMASLPIVRRLIALRTGIPVNMIRMGRLSNFARSKLVSDIATIAEMEADHPFYLVQGDLSSTVEDLVLRVQELRPTALYVDGAYLLRTSSKTQARWERVGETAEMLKRIAGEFLIPAIATYQFNRRGPGSLGNIANSDIVGQLASIVIGVEDERDSEAESKFAVARYKVLEVLKGREGERGAIRVLYDMERMKITQEGVLKGVLMDRGDD